MRNREAVDQSVKYHRGNFVVKAIASQQPVNALQKLRRVSNTPGAEEDMNQNFLYALLLTVVELTEAMYISKFCSRVGSFQNGVKQSLQS
jgi:hypothetical protein